VEGVSVCVGVALASGVSAGAEVCDGRTLPAGSAVGVVEVQPINKQESKKIAAAGFIISLTFRKWLFPNSVSRRILGLQQDLYDLWRLLAVLPLFLAV
jgi:hypothetical protein